MRKHKNKLLFVVLVTIVYVILKIYVINTLNKNDDNIPDIIPVLLIDQD